jgi:hypothetical protein
MDCSAYSGVMTRFALHVWLTTFFRAVGSESQQLDRLWLVPWHSAAFLSVGFGRLMRFLYRGLPSRPRFPMAFGPIVKPEIFTDKHMPPSATKFRVKSSARTSW